MPPKSRFVVSPERMERLQAIAREVNAAQGIPAPGTSSVTAEELKERQVRRGLNPHDLIFQRELMRMRCREDENK